jgi:hypothetical protein
VIANSSRRTTYFYTTFMKHGRREGGQSTKGIRNRHEYFSAASSRRWELFSAIKIFSAVKKSESRRPTTHHDAALIVVFSFHIKESS